MLPAFTLAWGSFIGIVATGAQPDRSPARQVAPLITSIRGKFRFPAYRVLVAGSVEIRYSESGTLGASRRQPEVRMASQRPGLITDRMLPPPGLTRYTELSRGISAKAPGNGLYRGPWSGAASWAGARRGQPDVTPPRQVRVLIADSVSSLWFIANSVCTAASIAATEAPAPVVTAGGACRQPEVTVALQVAPLITETVPSL